VAVLSRLRSGRGVVLGRLVLRRVLLAIPTLFGISLVTFALVNLAPGEPDAGTGGGSMRSTAVTREAAENVRRTYGLDLPVFLNFDVQDRGRRIRRSLRELDQPATAPLAQRRLVLATTLGLDEVVAALAQAGPSKRLVLRRILAQILEILRTPGGRSLAQGPGDAIEKWWKGRRRALGPEAVRAAVWRLVAGKPGADLAVRRIHRRAVAPLMARLVATQDPAVRVRLTHALSDITGHVVMYDPAAPLAERRSVMGQWRDWWRAEETVHRDLSGPERFVGVFGRTRYARWLGRLVRGDFGESHYFKQRSADVIAERLPVTLALNLAALLLAYLLSVPLGVWSAVNRGRWLDRAVTAGLFVLYSLPTFWVALMLIIFLGGVEGPDLFPTSGLHSFRPQDYPAGSPLLDLLWHAVLPVFCLSYAALAVVSRYGRAGMVEVLDQDYIRTARAKGLGEGTVVWKHGLRNGIIPLVNLLGLQIPYLLSGSVIIETIFDIPGLGSLTLLAIQQRDTNVLMGVISITALLSMGGLLLADLLMLWADPRISLERSPQVRP
jgi:peptide/nickel transport system permease protein